MNLSVVILSYHSFHLIEKIIKNIDKKIPIIVIENSRNKKLKLKLEKKYKNINVIIPSKNLGFAPGMNLGIKKSRNNFVLCLTADIKITKKCINDLKKCVKKFTNFSLLAPTYNNEKIYKNYQIYKYKENHHKKSLSKYGILEVDWIDGGGFIYNKKKMNNVGLYDEKFFFYYEQEDLCRRIRQIDQKIYVCQKIKFDHAGSKSSHPKFQHQVKIMRNWHYCWAKFYYIKKELMDIKEQILVALGLNKAEEEIKVQ